MADNRMIWVVDDDPAIRELLTFIVTEAGYEADAFASGAEVLASSSQLLPYHPEKGLAFDLPCLQVDGNDPLAVHVAINEALDRARRGEGPTVIEAVTYRLMMHTTADDPKKYRTEQEEKDAWAKEPLLRTRKYLEARGFWDDGQEAALRTEVKAQVEAAVKEFETPKDWAADEPFAHVYGTEHDSIREQRDEFLAEVRRAAQGGANHG